MKARQTRGDPLTFERIHLTPVAVERLASVMNHLPIFLDDTKNAKRKNDIPSIDMPDREEHMTRPLSHVFPTSD